MASYIWNPLSYDFIRTDGYKMGLTELIPLFKRDVRNNLFYDRKVLHLVRQLLFLISPLLLKKLHKNL